MKYAVYLFIYFYFYEALVACLTNNIIPNEISHPTVVRLQHGFDSVFNLMALSGEILEL